MAQTHTITWTYAWGNQSLSTSKTFSGDAEGAFINVTVPDSTTNQQVSMAMDVSQVTALIVLASVDMTFKTNSSGSPTNTLSLKAGIPYLFFTNSYDTNKITGDITVGYVTNASGGSGTLQIMQVYDSTP